MLIPTEQEFFVTGLGRRVFDRVFGRSYAFAGETHDYWEGVYVEDGEIEVAERDEVYLMRSGDLLFHAPMEFHRIRAYGDTEPHVHNFSFSLSGHVPDKLADGIFALSPSRGEALLSLLRELRASVTEEGEAAGAVGAAGHRLAAFLTELCGEGETRERLSTTSPANTYRALTRAMASAVCENATLPALAARCFVSVSYAKALFARYAGISPKAYYNSLRLGEARRLLLDGASVTEVSEALHFSSPNNLIRFFKREAGVTPLQYKNKARPARNSFVSPPKPIYKEKEKCYNEGAGGEPVRPRDTGDCF
ncbi:MAG: helix-turn-helix domain-containing protein [Clostridia bacterium]|nr:helix-turn-helix domain-containing protein [Clostridia bacterium]